MDGARPASGNTALTKAVAAATFRRRPARSREGEPDLLLSLSPAVAATPAGAKDGPQGRGTDRRDGQVVGAVGIGGGTGDQDVRWRRRASRALLDGLGKK